MIYFGVRRGGGGGGGGGYKGIGVHVASVVLRVRGRVGPLSDDEQVYRVLGVR